MSVVDLRRKAHDVEADMMVQAAATSGVAAGRVAQVRERLRRRAWVFDDPRSYTAGVDEALQAIAELSSSSDRSSVPAPPAVPPPRSHTA